MEQHQPTPLKCPRCNSLNTKFRYFNNNNPAQPRHYCKNCKRQWTVGGNMRNIPIGGKTTKASSSSGGNPRSQVRQPWLSLSEQHQQKSDTTMYQPSTNMSPLDAHYFNDEISCLDAIQSLIQPEINSQHVMSSNVTTLQELNVQTTTSLQSYQTCNIITNNVPPSHHDFTITTSDAYPWNNFNGDAIYTEDTASVNVDEWLNFPRDDPS